ncbi:MAG TPA: hypothetical protein VHL99_12775 [Candidatus Binatia bacterium]|jgi:hypothetical protein|nr:hypothetical protein [Candidatus Binatia bacterium]
MLVYLSKMARQKTWTAVLQCFACNRLFTVTGLTADKIGVVAWTPCAHCGAKPPTQHAGIRSEMHRSVDLREETGKDVKS